MTGLKCFVQNAAGKSRLIHNFTTTTASEEYFPVTMEEVRKIYLNRKYMYLLEGKELDKYLMTKELLK